MIEALDGNMSASMENGRKVFSSRIILLLFFYTLGINVPEGGLKKLVKMKRLGISKIPCGHKRAYYHAEEQR